MNAHVLKPVISEKAVALTEQNQTYAFVVPKTCSKLTIAKLVGDQFKVKVAKVRTTNIQGKFKQTMVHRGRIRIPGRRSDFKKAYVTLAKGESIKLFEEKK